MAEVHVRKMEDWVVDALRARARRHHRSLEAEVRQLLHDEVTDTRKRLVDQLERGLNGMEARHGLLPDSAAGIRADRDARG